MTPLRVHAFDLESRTERDSKATVRAVTTLLAAKHRFHLLDTKKYKLSLIVPSYCGCIGTFARTCQQTTYMKIMPVACV